IRILTSPGDTLQTTIDDSPDPVTEGNDVQYTLTVKNLTAGTIPAHVVNTLPAGATLKYAPPSCTGTTVIDCDLGSVAGGAEAVVKIVVTSPLGAGSMVNTATATPGVNSTASETTTIEAAADGVSKGWVMANQSLSTTGHDPANVFLTGGDGAPIIINQASPTAFCGGACAGPMTSVEPFTGYGVPSAPVRLRLEWNFFAGQHSPNAVTAAATAYFKSLYVRDPGNPSLGAVIPDCDDAGIAIPNPCLDTKTLDESSIHGNFVVTFEVLYNGQAITVGRAA
ncbi:MAG TPA: hypothetical protein VNC41_12065, partial [Acidimicrobiia bacterium]|nr:hypothetical protein [Acidimicrobiia bacterium]